MSFFAELKRRNVVRVGIAYVIAAWLLMQFTDVLIQLLELSPGIGKIVVLFLLIGFPIALIFAWAFELTPDGIKRDSEVDRSQASAVNTGRKLDFWIIGFLGLVIVLLLVERFILPVSTPTAMESNVVATQNSGPDTAEPAGTAPLGTSVAVLPFVNMSSDPEQEFFSDGISEEILNVLTRIPELKVAARTSSFQFKGQNQDIADIARQLKVSHVLEGSVRKSGGQLRITAQLIEAENGYHLWSETYDRQLSDVFAIQDEISGAIADELRVHLGAPPLPSAQTVDLAAYELYLKGRSLVASRREAALMEAFELLRAAIDIAPDYAPAMATLARGYAVLPWFSELIPSGEAREQARQWATRALSISPDNDEAMAALSIVLREADLDLDGSLTLLKRALETNPGSVAAHNFIGDYYTRSGNLPLALLHESRAAELDPLGPVQLSDLANVYGLMGEYERELALGYESLKLDPGFQNGLQHLMAANMALGNLEGMREALARAEANGMRESRLDSLRLQIYVVLGDDAAVRDLLNQRVDLVRQGLLSPSGVALDAVIAGDFDLAGTMLKAAVAANDGTWTYPGWVRLPEQAPDSQPWQEFWALPGPAKLAETRRRNGLDPQSPGFGGEQP